MRFHAPLITLPGRSRTSSPGMIRAVLAQVVALSCVVAWVSSGDAAESRLAVLRDGRRVRGTLEESDGRLAWRASDGKLLSLTSLRWVDGVEGSVSSPRWPLRQIALRGGGSLTAGWIGSSEKSVRLSLWNDQLVEVPVAVMESFGPLASERELFFDDFGESRGEWREEGGPVEIVSVADEEEGESAMRLTAGTSVSIAVPGRRSDLRLALRYRLPSKPVGPAWKVALRAAGDMGKDATEVLSVRFEKNEGSPRLAGTDGARFDHQELRVAAGWRQLTLLVQDRRVHLLIDGQLRASGRVPATAIDGVLLEADSAAESPRVEGPRGDADRWSVLVDDVQIQGLVPLAIDRREEWRQEPGVDALRLRSGDALFGGLERATRADVGFVAAGQRVSMRWKDVERVTLRDRSCELSPVDGVIARLWLRGPSDRPATPIPGDSLVVAMVAIDRNSLGVHHPSLGRISIPHGAVRRIEPWYRGRLQMIDTEVHHYGSAVRGEFRRPLPEDRPHEIEFEAESVAAGEQAVLCMATRDVEPCGRDVPPGSPHLAELRAGGLRTEVMLNGVGLGDLNSQLTWKQAVPDDLVVRLAVPAGLLKKGRNVVRVSQRPARLDPDSFDDCEVGPMWLEIRRGE
ncbi:MAG: hypothetical protein IT428_18005 [Planctomycetaceae bacterium]|nr:hypothetical protein [Planctomycetaceae bacterium]